jgi:hypothetical protein
MGLMRKGRHNGTVNLTTQANRRTEQSISSYPVEHTVTTTIDDPAHAIDICVRGGSAALVVRLVWLELPSYQTVRFTQTYPIERQDEKKDSGRYLVRCRKWHLRPNSHAAVQLWSSNAVGGIINKCCQYSNSSSTLLFLCLRCRLLSSDLLFQTSLFRIL